ncbi:MAG: helix-hairpin-helix domain-containing protein [Myxococcales bacterium]|nr:helix-hairpin-helix domain-containing protein [Myxococcales bacterium]
MDPEALASLELPAQVNEASAEELDSLPGIGPVLAGRVIAARPIESVDALLDVRGIGPKKLASLRPRARVRW